MTSTIGGPGGQDAWEILAHLWRLMQSVLDESAPVLEPIGLTPKAFFLLSAVEEYPFPAELARVMHLPPPSVTYLIKQVEAKGFVRRTAEPCDLRKFRLVLTDEGRRAIESGREALGSVLAGRLRRLEPGQVEALDRAVEQLARPSAGAD